MKNLDILLHINVLSEEDFGDILAKLSVDKVNTMLVAYQRFHGQQIQMAKSPKEASDRILEVSKLFYCPPLGRRLNEIPTGRVSASTIHEIVLAQVKNFPFSHFVYAAAGCTSKCLQDWKDDIDSFQARLKDNRGPVMHVLLPCIDEILDAILDIIHSQMDTTPGPVERFSQILLRLNMLESLLVEASSREGVWTLPRPAKFDVLSACETRNILNSSDPDRRIVKLSQSSQSGKSREAGLFVGAKTVCQKLGSKIRSLSARLMYLRCT